MVSFVSTLLSIREASKIGGSDKVCATFSGLCATSTGLAG